MKYKIYEPNLRTLQQRLTNLNTKLARIKMPLITFQITGHVDEPSADDATKLVRYYDLEVNGTTPSSNGWEFIATLVHTDEGNILRTVPGYNVPVEFRDRPTYCDHCKTNRTRLDTYIVRHTDGRVMQVGSSCLEDFIGTAPGALTKAAEHLLNAYDVCDAAQSREWLGGSNSLSVFRIDLETFLKQVAATVLADGRYITRKMESDSNGSTSATSTRAYRNMGLPVSPEAEELAAKARQWVLSTYSPALTETDDLSDEAIRSMVVTSLKAVNTRLSDFEHNLLACARAESIEPRLCGISAYIVEAYRRSVPKPGATQLDVGGLARIYQLFNTAKASLLKHPTVKLVDDAGNCIKLSFAGPASKNAGCLYVKGSDYFGKITPEGKFFPVSNAPQWITPLLEAFAKNPEEVATKIGKLLGECCFCSRKLEDDRSLEVGYGSTCAKNFGLRYPTMSELKKPVLEVVSTLNQTP